MEWKNTSKKVGDIYIRQFEASLGMLGGATLMWNTDENHWILYMNGIQLNDGMSDPNPVAAATWADETIKDTIDRERRKM